MQIYINFKKYIDFKQFQFVVKQTNKHNFFNML